MPKHHAGRARGLRPDAWAGSEDGLLGRLLAVETPSHTHRQTPASPAEGASRLPWAPQRIPGEELSAPKKGRQALGQEGGMGTGREETGQRPHSHRNPGGRAIPKQQVAGWEVGDAELAHHVALRVEDPAHRNAFALGQVQNHLQGQSDIWGPRRWAEGALGRTWLAAPSTPHLSHDRLLW